MAVQLAHDKMSGLQAQPEPLAKHERRVSFDLSLTMVHEIVPEFDFYKENPWVCCIDDRDVAGDTSDEEEDEDEEEEEQPSIFEVTKRRSKIIPLDDEDERSTQPPDSPPMSAASSVSADDLEEEQSKFLSSSTEEFCAETEHRRQVLDFQSVMEGSAQTELDSLEINAEGKESDSTKASLLLLQLSRSALLSTCMPFLNMEFLSRKVA